MHAPSTSCFAVNSVNTPVALGAMTDTSRQSDSFQRAHRMREIVVLFFPCVVIALLSFLLWNLVVGRYVPQGLRGKIVDVVPHVFFPCNTGARHEFDFYGFFLCNSQAVLDR